jgi:hypothetical protein
MWDDRFAEVCRRHEDLVAVYESGRGRLGLLLDPTMVPLEAERADWVARTRASARRIADDLRAAGFDGATVILQWLPPADVARIVSCWVRRWDGDPSRRSQLVGQVEAAVSGSSRPLDETGLEAIRAWYETMAPCWLAIQPVRRRRLVLQTHVWIAERVLTDPRTGPEQGLQELGPEGPLARALARLIPRSEMATWRRWVELVRLDLQRALHRPPDRRTPAWARWLCFIPYGLPVPRRAPLRVLPGGAPTSRFA